MGYNPIEEELKWWARGNGESESSRRSFAHSITRSRLYDTLLGLGCSRNSTILDVGCGAGGDAVHIRKISENITGIDISKIAIRKFRARGFKGIIADAKSMPFRDGSFDFVVCSGLLHHLVGQGDLRVYLKEFVRVARGRGYVIALEPNIFNQSGLMMNVFNALKPGITGLVPHERALSPLWLAKIFRESGLKQVEYVAASYVWNRFPLCLSKFISEHETAIRLKKPFSLFGWFEIVYGRKE